MNSMILETTIDALEEILSSRDDSMTMIDRVEEAVHDTLTLLNIRRRRPCIDDYLEASDEVELLRHMSKMLMNLNTMGKTEIYKTEKQVQKVITQTIKKISIK